MTQAIILLTVVALAYANGANDNMKGVATLFGSGTTNYRGALLWATCTTLVGSLAAVLLAGKLIKAFSGKGLVDAATVASPTYVAAVALGAALTVLLATRVGMPISTTHALIGALVGSAVAASSSINSSVLGEKLLKPLLVSPFVALGATIVIYPLLKLIRSRFNIGAETCICVQNRVVEYIPANCPPLAVVDRIDHWSIVTGTTATCSSRYAGHVLGFEAAVVLDKLHFLSAGVVCFARGLNDTPKIAAMLLMAPAVGSFSACVAVGLLIALGGWLSARRVAETMSRRITPMNHGQGFTANVVTGVIIILASKFGMPVSTTHVSCGALFGIGAVTGAAQWRTIATILAAWITTLPLGCLLGYGSFIALHDRAGLCYVVANVY